jgi:hypothetical protein
MKTVISVSFTFLVFLALNPLVYAQKISLEKELTIGGEGQVFFGEVADMDVGNGGRIYIADRKNNEIKVFSKEGKMVQSVGREGRGPKEFKWISDIAVTKERLVAFDLTQQRLTAFELENLDRVAYTSLLSDISSVGSPSKLIGVLNQKIVLIEYTTSYTPSNEKTDKVKTLFAVNSEGETMGDAIISVPQSQNLVKRSGGSMLMTSMPFGRKSIIRLGQHGRIYYGWSDEVNIKVYTSKGNQVEVIKGSHESVEVTQNDMENLLNSYSSEDFKEAIREADLPSVWPAYESFLVDNEDRVWIEMNTENREQSSWVIFNKEGERIYTVKLPQNVALKAVQGGYAYGVETGKNGGQTVVRYDIDSE